MPSKISPARRAASRTFYGTCIALLLVGAVNLFMDISGNLWVFCLFGAIVAFIIGNALAYPGGMPSGENREEKQTANPLSNEERYRIVQEQGANPPKQPTKKDEEDDQA